MKYKICARSLVTGETVEKINEPLYDNFVDAREAGRRFMLEKQEETGVGWMWHLEEIED